MILHKNENPHFDEVDAAGSCPRMYQSSISKQLVTIPAVFGVTAAAANISYHVPVTAL